jgi:hypothetical protein
LNGSNNQVRVGEPVLENDITENSDSLRCYAARQRIVNLVRAEYERAAEAFRHAHAERVGIDAAANAWDDFNKDDGIGCISQNPHNTIAASKREEAAKLYASQMREAYSHAVDTFIGADKSA